MGLSKHQEHDMNDLGTYLLKMVLGLVRPTLLSSLEKWVKVGWLLNKTINWVMKH
jgi:hypothetical protein